LSQYNHTEECEALTRDLRERLVRTGGGVSHDLGLGRIVGQLLVYLYFQPSERSLDEIETELGLSKAAVSIAARQLDSLGMVKRVWRPGDKRSYYKSADNLATALGQGLISTLRRRLDYIDIEFQQVLQDLTKTEELAAGGEDAGFLKDRLQRAIVLESRLQKLLSGPLVKLLTEKH
jgi:DNA-binding transcriptional regulator GbsR (MarR family)